MGFNLFNTQKIGRLHFTKLAAAYAMKYMMVITSQNKEDVPIIQENRTRFLSLLHKCSLSSTPITRPNIPNNLLLIHSSSLLCTIICFLYPSKVISTWCSTAQVPLLQNSGFLLINILILSSHCPLSCFFVCLNRCV